MCAEEVIIHLLRSCKHPFKPQEQEMCGCENMMLEKNEFFVF